MLLALSGLAAPALAQDWHWTGAVSDQWSNPGNWLFNTLPTEQGHVKLGSLDGVENTDVELDMSETIGALDIVDGMGLWTDFRSLYVSGDTLVSGRNYTGFGERSSTLSVGAVDGLSFRTRDLTIADEGRYWLYNAYTRVYGTFGIDADSDFRGNGHVGLWGPDAALVNDGLVFPGSGMGLHLTPYNGATIDLDGASGDGLLFLASHDQDTGESSKLRVDGDGLSDAFSGRIVMVSGTDLFMNLADGWTADDRSEIAVGGSIDAPLTPAVIRGGDFTFAGSMSVAHTNTEGYLRVESSRFTLGPGAIVTLDPDTRAHFGAPGTEVVIRGGDATIEAGAELWLTGATEWDGQFAAAGVVRQMADATVTGPTLIDAEILDMDGAGAPTWNVHDGLVINAANIDHNHFTRFDGTMNIAGGFFGRLTLNLDTPGASWAMNGVMSLTGDPNIFVTRLAGSPMHITGSLSVPSGKAAATADLVFTGSGVATIATAATALRLGGATLVEADARFEGLGTLVNAASGRITLEDGADLGPVGLENGGVLRIGAGRPGAATVNRFQNSGLIRLDIGGYLAGEEHDSLAVAGNIALGGRIEIDLLDTSDGQPFDPQPGDSFNILSAGGEISGAFADDPVTFAGGSIYEWRIVHGLKRVSVQLERVSECVGDFNADGVVNTIDLILFLNAWNAQEPAADMNRDGLINTADVVAFLNLWSYGC